MVRFKLPVLALTAASLAATGAHAATALQGGGSTLFAPVWGRSAVCWDIDPANGAIIRGGVSSRYPNGLPPCPRLTGTVMTYVAADAGAAVAAVFIHDGSINLFGTFPPGGKIFPTGGIQYGFSDNALVDGDVGVYTVGTGQVYTPPAGRPTITTVATYQGVTISPANAPKPKYGALVQFPVSIDPVAISFNPSYDGVHNLQVSGGVLRLDATAYCKIFTGQITNWNDTYLTSLNGGASLTVGGASASIHLVGDSASSGTTSIFTRHLAKVCDAVLGVGSNPYGSAGVTTLPTGVIGLFTLADGSGGVADTLHATNGSIGYIGPDYVLPAVNNTGLNAWNLPAAALKNAAGNFKAPTAATAASAFSGINPPSIFSRADPTLWVQSTSETAPIANPSNTDAYPIVGTTNFIGYTCYANVASVNSLRSFVSFLGGTQGAAILSTAGLAQLPTAWLDAINNTFLNTSNAANGLFFAQAASGSDGNGHTNANCTIPGVVGG